MESPDTSKRAFDDKLEDQLSHVSAGAQQLCAEMMWVMMLFPSNIRQGTKTALVRKIWAWSGAPLPDPRGALGALADGIGSGGTGYNNYRHAELQLPSCDSRPPGKTCGLPTGSASLQTLGPWLAGSIACLTRHLDSSATCSSTSSFQEEESSGSLPRATRRIDKRYAKRLTSADLPPADGGPSALARDRRLQKEFVRHSRPSGPESGSTSTGRLIFKAEWKKAEQSDPRQDEGPEDLVSEGARVWAIGAGEGARRWPAFLEDGLVAIGWDDLGDLENASHAELHAALKNVYESERDPRNDSLACYGILSTKWLPATPCT